MPEKVRPMGADRPWPAVSIDDTYRILTAPGMPFEMEETVVRGRSVRAYKNALRSLREVFDLGRSWGGREFIVYEGERQTYEAHFKAAGALGRILSERYGVKKGDRIVIAMRNLPEWSLAFWAGQSIGAVVAPLNAWGLGPDLVYGIQDCGAKVALLDGERLERLAPHIGEVALDALIAVRAPQGPIAGAVMLEDLIGPPSAYSALPDDPPPDPGLDPDDDATILYTSGTTGRPKGALGAHRNVLTNLVSLGFSGARAAIRRGDPLPQPDP
nr:steroid-24-oyl-CoA synthetase [Phenylobacterium sp.]